MSEHGRFLTVREIVDPTVLGVHPAPGGARGAYVRRDRHEDIVGALRPGAVVLVTGPACAGTSRAAFEAVAAALPDHTLIVPRGGASVDDVAVVEGAVAAMARHPRSVLWLDLDLYRGVDLTGEVLARAVAHGAGHRVVVAVMNSAPPRPGPPIWGTGGVLRRFPRATLATLGRARHIHLSRRFSPGELQRARELSGDGLIAAALRHPGASELAAVLAGAPERLVSWRAAASGANPRGAALVTAALECQRAGIDTAPRALLEALGEQYLQRSSGVVGDPGAATVAWEWAIAWEWALNTAALREVGGRFQVSGYLLEHAAADTLIPNPTLRDALEYAEGREVARVAATAHHQGQLVLADAGYRRAHDHHVARFGPEAPATLEVAHDRAMLLADRGKPDEALAGLLRVLSAQHRVLGPHHPATLATAQNLTSVQCAWGPSDAALARARSTVHSHEAALGAQHPATLGCRLNLGIALARLQRLPDAAAELRLVAQQSRGGLGPDHSVTLAARHQLALVLGSQGLWAGAEAEREAVLAAQRRVWGNDHPATLTSRHERARLLRACGRLDDAVEEISGVLAARTAVLGTAHPATVDSRQLLAEFQCERGDHERGDRERGDRDRGDRERGGRDGLVEELEAVRVLRSGLHGPDHPATLDTRHALARLRWDLGDVHGAGSELAAVVAARIRILGADALPALTARHDLAVLTAERGELDSAAGQLSAVTVDCVRVLGPEHPATVAARHDEARVAAMVEVVVEATATEQSPDRGEPRPSDVGDVGDVDDVEERQRRGVELYLEGDYAAAEPLLRDVLVHRERALGAEHPVALACAHNVAMVLYNRGLRAEALALHRTVLTARRGVLGAEDPATLASQHDVAVVLWELGDVTGAAAGFEAALAGRVQVLGVNDPATVISRDNLDVVLARLISNGDDPAQPSPVPHR